MFGYQEPLLKETIENLKLGSDPVGKLAANNAPWFKKGNMQVHVSFQRLRKLIKLERPKSFLSGIAAEHPFSNALTSVSLSLDPDYWQTVINMPVEEIKPGSEFSSWIRKRQAKP